MVSARKVVILSACKKMVDARRFQSLKNGSLPHVNDCFKGENNDADNVFLLALYS
jgi:hypothetical protein